MKTAHIITDVGFGDSGKGVMTDRIAAQNPDAVVIRSTGGSQAGHTVDLNMPGTYYQTKRHIHSSFASGALGGFRSHMSHFCPIYPQKLVREAKELAPKKPYEAKECSVDPLAPMITIYDVAWNRANQAARNTVGIGIGATMDRMLHSEFRTYMVDLLESRVLNQKLHMVHAWYQAKLNGIPRSVRKKFDEIVQLETLHPQQALRHVSLVKTELLIEDYDCVIFEGAQGVMLDQDHGFQPHTTWGYTTSRNAVEMLLASGEKWIVQPHHVTRAYMTRHGAGPMPTDKVIQVPADLTNVENPYQGPFVTGQLSLSTLDYALQVDNAYLGKLRRPLHVCNPTHLHITCCDHVEKSELARPLVHFTGSKLIGEIFCWRTPYRCSPSNQPELP